MSARSLHPIGRNVQVDPALAAADLSAKLERFNGSITTTAKSLGVDHATLRRWIRVLKEAGHEVGPTQGPGKPRHKKPSKNALALRRWRDSKKDIAKPRMMR